MTVVTSRAYLLRYVYTQGSNPGTLQLCGVVYVLAAPHADPLVQAMTACMLVLCSRPAGAEQNARHHCAACVHGLDWRTHLDRASFWRHCGDTLPPCKVSSCFMIMPCGQALKFTRAAIRWMCLQCANSLLHANAAAGPSLGRSQSCGVCQSVRPPLTSATPAAPALGAPQMHMGWSCKIRMMRCTASTMHVDRHPAML